MRTELEHNWCEQVSKPMARERMPYNTSAWQRLRAHQLSAFPLCAMCAARGRVTVATVCDHIDPHRGDHARFWAGPFQSLCTPCHSGDKQRQERGGKTRPVIGNDGWPL